MEPFSLCCKSLLNPRGIKSVCRNLTWHPRSERVHQSKRRGPPVEPHTKTSPESKPYLVVLGWSMGIFKPVPKSILLDKKMACLSEAIFVTEMRSHCAIRFLTEHTCYNRLRLPCIFLIKANMAMHSLWPKKKKKTENSKKVGEGNECSVLTFLVNNHGR